MHAALALFLSYRGDSEDAYTQAKRAESFDHRSAAARAALCRVLDWSGHIADAVAAGRSAVGLAGAFPYAGSWNDGSRLAAVESLVDHHTLAIEDSIFVRVPADAAASGRAPYPAHNDDLLQSGTRDKLLIKGHFYSDKPAVISFLMAGWYWLCECCGLPSAAQRPDLFCRMMTVATSAENTIVPCS